MKKILFLLSVLLLFSSTSCVFRLFPGVKKAEVVKTEENVRTAPDMNKENGTDTDNRQEKEDRREAAGISESKGKTIAVAVGTNPSAETEPDIEKTDVRAVSPKLQNETGENPALKQENRPEGEKIAPAQRSDGESAPADGEESTGKISLPISEDEKLPPVTDKGKKADKAEDANAYRIGSGDILEIVTWKEPDFTREIIVRLDGKITFPLLDDVHVAGLTPLKVKHRIEEGLKEYVTAPIVTVSVKGAESQKFYILGEISRTGEYKLAKNLTVLQAFALAGGFTEWASKKEIILIRHEHGREKIIRINYKNIARGRDFSQNIFIQANDTIIVP